METIKWAVNHMPKTEDANLPVMALSEVEKARTFHESFPQYSVTPLVKLNHMAEKLGLGSLYIKDESYRFGLNAFKAVSYTHLDVYKRQHPTWAMPADVRRRWNWCTEGS